MANRRTEYRIKRFMAVTADFQPEGLNMSCWMSSVDAWLWEKPEYPHEYKYQSGDCDWLIHCNMELTSKMVSAVGEYAQKICNEQIKIQGRRRTVGR